MESQKRTELVDALLEEARQMITVLLKASTVPDMSRDIGQGTAKGRFTLKSSIRSRMSADAGRRCLRTSRKHGSRWGRSSNRNGTDG